MRTSLAVVSAVLIGLLVSVMIPRVLPQSLPSARQVQLRPRLTTLPQPGVDVMITVGSLSVQRQLSAMAFSVGEGESLDARVPPGPFEAICTVRFKRGGVRRARIGAWIRNGSLLIRRGDEVLLTDAAGEDQRLAMTTVPVSIHGDEPLVYEFRSTGDGGATCRAMWEPESSWIPLPLPAEGRGSLKIAAVRGESLVQTLQCVACHQSRDPALQQRLDVSPGPILTDIGRRINPGWITEWLRDPASLNHTTVMPNMLGTFESPDRTIAELTRYLVSLGGPFDDDDDTAPPDVVRDGMVLYHEVGCFACHGPLEPLEQLPGGRTTQQEPYRTYVAVGDLRFKTSVSELARFLQDPVAMHPSGRMPSQNLTQQEAQAVASYLMQRGGSQPTPGEASLPHERLAERGAAHFELLGCANCHEVVRPDGSIVQSQLSAQPLESLLHFNVATGCIAETSQHGHPHYSLSNRDRNDILAFLRGLAHEVSPRAPLDELAVTLHRLNCYACHAYAGDIGPEGAVARYFTTLGDADLGDEGRLPPEITDVGAKLTKQWMHRMLTEPVSVRPYLAARMPLFGEGNVRHLPHLFTAAAGAAVPLAPEPEFSTHMAEIGRTLVGAKALNCIQCHSIGGRDSTGTPGPDLAQMTERLRYDAFNRWLHDPGRVRPGTRMPSFFVNGRSGFTDILGGRAQEQIDAMWNYLSQGEFAPMPEGLTDPEGFVLEVLDEPLVFRTYMAEAGVRAIACGFPEQIHYAFNPDRCMVTAIWRGQFLNAQGAWGSRGGTETNPGGTVWSAGADPLFVTMTDGDGVRFRGYRLDEQRRPVFSYDVVQDGREYSITQRAHPKVEGGGAWVVSEFSIDGPVNGSLRLNISNVVPGYGTRTMEVKRQGRTVVELDEKGKASFTMELTW